MTKKVKCVNIKTTILNRYRITCDFTLSLPLTHWMKMYSDFATESNQMFTICEITCVQSKCIHSNYYKIQI